MSITNSKLPAYFKLEGGFKGVFTSILSISYLSHLRTLSYHPAWKIYRQRALKVIVSDISQYFTS